MNELIEFWNNINLEQKPYIQPMDKNIISDYCYANKGFEDYYENVHWNGKNLFHTDLIPMPYLGDLKNAKIFILLTNPGFSMLDYYAEEYSSDYVSALKSNLRQDNGNSDYPFLFLNPKYMWTGGGKYWFSKLKSYIPPIKKARQCSYIEATQYLSSKIAVLELMPYHSTKFTHHSLLKKLESVKIMKGFVQNDIFEKVQDSKVGIICTRKVKEWDLPNHKNTIEYQGSECRTASVSKNSRASDIFCKFL